MPIYRYIVVDADNEQVRSDWEDYDDAETAAGRLEQPTAVVEREYTFSDSQLIWTSTGDDFWPPPTLVIGERKGRG